MYVFYDNLTGAITYTATGGKDLVYGQTDWIEVPEQSLGELHAWKVINGALLLADMTPIITAAKLSMLEWINEYLSNITGPIPVDEKLAWTAKAEAARHILALTATPVHTAILEPEAQLRGISSEDLAERVMAKSNLYTAVVARVAGLRDVTWENLKMANSRAEVDEILAGAKARANGLAAQLGL